MTYRIISVGWNCPGQIPVTLNSIDRQTCRDFQVHMVDDASSDASQAEVMYQWIGDHGGDQWMATAHVERRFALRNQVEGIRAMEPDDEDVIVWLDLDGDHFANEQILDRLSGYYASGVDLTYGTHLPVTGIGPGYTKPIPYPDEVVANSDYRQYTLTTYCCFNHLRTMKYKIFRQIPDEYFHWLGQPGHWMEAGADYAIMMAGLELARGNYRCISEPMMIYNDQQPHPDNKYHPEVSDRANHETLHRPNVLDYLGLPR